MTQYDVLAIGNAIVDVIAQAEDSQIADLGLTKGAMTLIDDTRAESLYAAMGSAVAVSGGSAANTVAGIASLGGECAFIGKVRDDRLGGIFRHDIKAIGVDFETAAATSGPATARCLVFVTADAQRTMQTFLGACANLGPEDLDKAAIEGAVVTYLEGYLYDQPQAKQAFLDAAEMAHAAGRKVSLSLSDPFCVDRHRAEFVDLIANHVDILFANEAEVTSLFEVGGLTAALAALEGRCAVAAVTRGPAGSVVVAGSDRHEVAAAPVDKVVDTTGAGDLYAAGFLYGYTREEPLARCGALGGIAAGEIIGHMGARPKVSLASLIG